MLFRSRIYHVLTHLGDYADGTGTWGYWEWVRIWDGGIAIYGALIGGALGVWIGCRITGLRFWSVADAIAPGLLIAQAFGRLGNWFNQELFGRPTTLPWGLKIDLANRPLGYEGYETFHPTFLYEALWNLALAGLLVWLDRRRKLRAGELFILYVFGYSLGRLWVEDLRIDHASLIWGVRINIWMSVIVGISAIAIFAWNRRPGAQVPSSEQAVASGAEPEPEPEGDGDGAEVLTDDA